MSYIDWDDYDEFEVITTDWSTTIDSDTKKCIWRYNDADELIIDIVYDSNENDYTVYVEQDHDLIIKETFEKYSEVLKIVTPLIGFDVQIPQEDDFLKCEEKDG